MSSELRRINARAAGWPWCAEHDSPRYDGPDSCRSRHDLEIPVQTLASLDPSAAAELAYETAGDPGPRSVFGLEIDVDERLDRNEIVVRSWDGQVVKIVDVDPLEIDLRRLGI